MQINISDFPMSGDTTAEQLSQMIEEVLFDNLYEQSKINIICSEKYFDITSRVAYEFGLRVVLE
jgi:hypothetical protein